MRSGLRIGDGSERFPAVCGEDDVEPEMTEGGVEEEADVVLVVGDEDARRRGRREAHGPSMAGISENLLRTVSETRESCGSGLVVEQLALHQKPPAEAA